MKSGSHDPHHFLKTPFRSEGCHGQRLKGVGRARWKNIVVVREWAVAPARVPSSEAKPKAMTGRRSGWSRGGGVNKARDRRSRTGK